MGSAAWQRLSPTINLCYYHGPSPGGRQLQCGIEIRTHSSTKVLPPLRPCCRQARALAAVATRVVTTRRRLEQTQASAPWGTSPLDPLDSLGPPPHPHPPVSACHSLLSPEEAPPRLRWQ